MNRETGPIDAQSIEFTSVGGERGGTEENGGNGFLPWRRAENPGAGKEGSNQNSNWVEETK